MSIVDEVGDEVIDDGCISRYYIRHAEWWVTMWMQDAEMKNDKHVVYALTKSLTQVVSDSVQ